MPRPPAPDEPPPCDAACLPLLCKCVIEQLQIPDTLEVRFVGSRLKWLVQIQSMERCNHVQGAYDQPTNDMNPPKCCSCHAATARRDKPGL